MGTEEKNYQERVRDWLTDHRVVVIGLGGVGTHMIYPLTRFLYYLDMDLDMLLVDGDTFSVSNATRQDFTMDGVGRNKADVVHDTLAECYSDSIRLCFDHEEEYITDKNIEEMVQDGDVVFVCVDNHATRKLIVEQAQSLANITLISGGNDAADEPSGGTCGNIQVYHKQNGVEFTNAPTKFHPEIENPEDKNPADLDCLEAAADGSPQILFANLTVASNMVNAFFSLALTGKPPYEEMYFDIGTGKARPVTRIVEPSTAVA